MAEDEVLWYAPPKKMRDQSKNGERDVQSAVTQARERLAVWELYISFVFNKLVAIVCMVGGLAVLIHPTLLPQLHHPQYAIGAGVALLGSKSMLKLIGALTRAFA